MDVFEGEDGIYHVDRTDDILRNRNMAYLRQFPNVVLTPHMAFYTQLSMDSMMQNSVEGLIDFVRTGTIGLKSNYKKMKSLRELYRIGKGPSSSHTIGPERACRLFLHENPAADSFRSFYTALWRKQE